MFHGIIILYMKFASFFYNDVPLSWVSLSNFIAHIILKCSWSIWFWKTLRIFFSLSSSSNERYFSITWHWNQVTYKEINSEEHPISLPSYLNILDIHNKDCDNLKWEDVDLWILFPTIVLFLGHDPCSLPPLLISYLL